MRATVSVRCSDFLRQRPFTISSAGMSKSSVRTSLPTFPPHCAHRTRTRTRTVFDPAPTASGEDRSHTSPVTRRSVALEQWHPLIALCRSCRHEQSRFAGDDTTPCRETLLERHRSAERAPRGHLGARLPGCRLCPGLSERGVNYPALLTHRLRGSFLEDGACQ